VLAEMACAFPGHCRLPELQPELPKQSNVRRRKPEASVKLSILIPLYNEQEFVGTLLERVIAAPLPGGLEREIIVSDDGSTDSSVDEVRAVIDKHPGLIRLLTSEYNHGKGAALRRAIQCATGEFSIIQDADLEYDPKDYPKLLAPLLDGRADAVYGSRFVVSGERRVLYFWHSLANRILTTMCNMCSDLNLTDMETCYKAFRTPLLQSIPISSERFGFEPEITVKLAKRQARIFETPISYNGRTYAEGKKIGLKDAFDAFWVILRTSLSQNIYADKDKETLDAFSAAPNFNRWMADTVHPYVGRNVVEIGAGIGNLTRILMPTRKRYVATDLNTEHLMRLRARITGRPNLQICHLDISNAQAVEPFREQADTVICLNVLEHIEDDCGALKNIHALLQVMGCALILVPEGQSIFNALDEELGHCRRYSEDQLRERMAGAGFHVETIIRFNRVSRPGWWLSGSVMKRRSVSRLQLKLFDRFVWLWRRVDAYLPWAPTSIIVVGRKINGASPSLRDGFVQSADASMPPMHRSSDPLVAAGDGGGR
jgi:glycosyltransferase involved in cell wall biosynthesis